MKSAVLKNQVTVLRQSANATLVYFDNFVVKVPAQKQEIPKCVICSNRNGWPYFW